MSKSEQNEADEMREEYDFSNAIQGKYAGLYSKGTNVVVLDADVAEAFPDPKAVNEALRILARSMRREPKEAGMS
jgi:hypothetical protein